ncbi:MAG: hypothetical protein Q4D71_09395, partial [Oscillospiraceae bacterium]|nr:hypothetical protein [Oscillospiraceae bacterium]
MQQASGVLSKSSSGIRSVKSSLSFQIGGQSLIDKRLEKEIEDLVKEAEMLQRMKGQLEAILKAYLDTENRLAGTEAKDQGTKGNSGSVIDRIIEILDGIEGSGKESFLRNLTEKVRKRLEELKKLYPEKDYPFLLLMMVTGTTALADFYPGGGSGSEDGGGGFSSGLKEEEEDGFKFGAWPFTQNLADLISKYEKEVKNHKTGSSILGLGVNATRYLESLYNLYHGDRKSLPANACDLTDSSCNVWNGIYNLVEQKNKDLFKYVDAAGEHSTPYGAKLSNISNSVSILGESAAWAGDILKIFDDEKNQTGADKNAALISSTSHGVEIATTIYDWKSKADTAGLYTPAKIYGTIAESYIETGSVAYKDIRKLYADGEWSVDDTTQTMLDSSTAGLYKMVETLSFGLVSEKTTGLSAQQVSDHLQAGAKKWGTDAGNRVVNDPVRYKMYQEGNGFV